MPYTVWSKLVQGILNAAERANLKTDALLDTIGLDSAILQEVDVRIPHEQYCALWWEIAKISGEEVIGLRLAQLAEPTIFDAIGYAIDSCSNLSEALVQVERYSRLIHEGVKCTWETNGKVFKLIHTIPETHFPLPEICHQWILGKIVLNVRRTTGLNVVPLRVGFNYKQPEDVSAYYRLFQAPLEFEQPDNFMIFDAGLLNQPFPRANPGLFAVLDRYITELLAKLPSRESIVDSVRREISVRLRGGDPGLDAIAHQLAMTPRTLQRKLKEAGTSHQELLDEMRRELAIHYLHERQMAVCEIAFLLGFSETSAFHRAFKRWTGKTPGEFRRTLSRSA